MIGRYVIEERIGAGGMGEVWRGYDPRLDRPIALKQIRPDRAGDPIWRRRLRNEARAVAKLSHPAIVQIYDIVELPEGDWIVMEYLEGDSLARLLARGPVEHMLLLTVARDVAAALAEAHRKGILHRDLKAANVMVTREGRAKIFDFGLAEWSTASGQHDLRGDGALLGTLRSMSPEQASGHELDPRSDLFSLGALLYEMATATSPFAASTRSATLARICMFRPPPVHEQAPCIPVELSELVDRLLAKERDARPRDAGEVGAALDRITDALLWGATLPPTRSASEARSRATGPTNARRRRPRIGGGAWLAVAVAVAVAIAAAASLHRGYPDHRVRLPCSRPASDLVSGARAPFFYAYGKSQVEAKIVDGAFGGIVAGCPTGDCWITRKGKSHLEDPVATSNRSTRRLKPRSPRLPQSLRPTQDRTR